MRRAKNFHIKRDFRVLFLSGCLACLMQLPSFATQSLTLAWNPSSGPNVLGYKIYYGTASHDYDTAVSVGNVTNATVGGLVEGGTYFFAVTAYDISNQESFFSDEAAVVIPTNQTTTSSNLTAASTIVAGQSVTFDLTNAGTGPMNFQWEFNGNNIASATNAVLTLTNVTCYQAGQYSVNVSGSTSSTNSVTDSLMVYSPTPATLTQTAYANGQFNFYVSGAANQQYVVQASTNLVNWFPVMTNTAPFAFVDSSAGQFSQCFYRTFNYAGSNGNLTVNLAVPTATPSVVTQTANVTQQSAAQVSTNLVTLSSVKTSATPLKLLNPKRASSGSASVAPPPKKIPNHFFHS